MVRALNFGLGPHAITGNGVGFKPDILDMDVMESVLEVMLLISFHVFVFYQLVKCLCVLSYTCRLVVRML